MTDIVERLRKTASRGVSVWGDLQMEAADEIDALRTALAQPAPEPVCPDCAAPGLLYECVHCSANNYPQAQPAPAPDVPEDDFGDIPMPSREKREEFERLCNALPPDVCWGDPITADIVRSIIATFAPAPVVPDGWVMVPREPTAAMCAAGWQEFCSYEKVQSIGGIYCVMIAAAPAVHPCTSKPVDSQNAPDLAHKPTVQRLMDLARRFRATPGDLYDGAYKELERACYEALALAAVHDPAMGNPISPMKPLTDGQIDKIFDGAHENMPKGVLFRTFVARAIEAQHGIGTTGGGNG